MRDTQALADVVVMTVKAAMASPLERLAVAEAHMATLTAALTAAETALAAMHERMAIAETKALVLPPAAVPDVAVGERVTALETKAAALVPASVVDDLSRRVEALERPAPPPAVSAEDVAAVRDRLLAIELKTDGLATALAAPNPLVPVLEKTDRALAELTKDLGAMRERVAVVEVRPLVPGPQGEAGPPGRDGLDGKDGLAGLSFEGVYQEGQSYEKGHLVTWAGSSWHCNSPTVTKPGESKDWTLMVKRGRDGKDGKDLTASLPVVALTK